MRKENKSFPGVGYITSYKYDEFPSTVFGVLGAMSSTKRNSILCAFTPIILATNSDNFCLTSLLL